MSRIWYNSCRHRACPQCAYLQTERWLALQRARLLACDHYHVIFTLPHELNPLWLANVAVMTTLLFQAVRDTLSTLLADPKYLGAQPGILAAQERSLASVSATSALVLTGEFSARRCCPAGLVRLDVWTAVETLALRLS
jgi:hypothetical protein